MFCYAAVMSRLGRAYPGYLSGLPAVPWVGELVRCAGPDSQERRCVPSYC